MAQYTKALADDFNTIRNTVANVLGTGSSTKGYGSPVTSYAVVAGAKIAPAEFTALATDINACYRHITNADASTLASIVSGGVVTWANFVTYQAATTYINNNSDANGGARTTSVSSTTLPAGWGNASGNRVATMSGTITFASAEAMRFFFNQNAYITMTGSGDGAGGSDPKSASFRGLANGVGISIAQGNYRGGTAASATYYGSTNPYGYNPIRTYNDYIAVSFGAPSGTTVSFSIECWDKGRDGSVASNINDNLTFNINRVLSNTSGITQYNPSVSFGAWTYSA